MPTPRYETLPAPNTPEFRELSRELGDALGPVGGNQPGGPTGAVNPDDAFALLARFSPADRLTLTRGMLRITGGDTGRDIAAMPDRNIMLLLTNKFSTSSTGATRSYEGLEQALRLFADMPVNRQTTENLNYILRGVILDHNASDFLTSDDDARARRTLFFSGKGIEEDDYGNPYQRLRLIGITPGRKPVVVASTAIIVAPEPEPEVHVISGLPGMVFALASAYTNDNYRRNPTATVGSINVGGGAIAFSGFSYSHTQQTHVGSHTSVSSSHTMVQIQGGNVAPGPALLTV